MKCVPFVSFMRDRLAVGVGVRRGPFVELGVGIYCTNATVRKMKRGVLVDLPRFGTNLDE